METCAPPSTRSNHGTRGNGIFYLAVADRLFGAVVEQLGKAKLTDRGPERRPPILAPGGDRKAVTLHEDQMFRIDHFLGKDTVQNIMAFRFANGIFAASAVITMVSHHDGARTAVQMLGSDF